MPPFGMRPRSVTDRVRAALTDTPVVAIVGARQVGKSTLLQHLVETSPHGWTSLTLDDLNVLERATRDPAGLLASLPGPLALDEVQRAPDLLLAIKSTVDRDRRPGRFLLTGSADVFALPRYGDALTGRVESVTLRPFSQGELAENHEDFVTWAFSAEPPPPLAPAPADLPQRVVAGGYPPSTARPSAERRRAWFDAYWSTSLQRDVQDVAGIARWTELPRLARLVAARTSQTVNHAEMARTSGLPATTLARYLQVLQALFLIEEIPAWSTNAGKRIARRPKMLVSDTGLAAALLGMTAATWDADRPIATRGPLLESFVALELAKQLGWSATPATLHHYREHDGAEIDLLLEARDGGVVGVEVKASHQVGRDAVRHLERLRDDLGARFVRGLVLHAGTTAAPLADRIWALPIHALWTVGGHAASPPSS
jgi:uncharacterized protein